MRDTTRANRANDRALITAARVEGRVTVRDGRKLAFAEWGPVGGRAVVWLHGTPGARRQIPEAARVAAEELDVRLIGIDRPGVGLSTPHLYDSVLDFVPDLEIVLDELGVEDFRIIGLSGGGPYTLAAAYQLGDRVLAAGVLGGVAPTRGPDAAPGGLVGLAVRFAPLFPPLRPLMAMGLTGLVRVLRPFGPQALRMYARISPEGDREVLLRPEVGAMFLDDLIGNGRRGLGAPVNDIILFTRDWGFSVRDLEVPVRWWHGDADHIVPLAHGEHVVSLITDAELYLRPGESHLGGLGAAEEVLGTLLALGDDGKLRVIAARSRAAAGRASAGEPGGGDGAGAGGAGGAQPPVTRPGASRAP